MKKTDIERTYSVSFCALHVHVEWCVSMQRTNDRCLFLWLSTFFSSSSLLTEFKVQCFSQTGRSESSYPSPMLGLQLCTTCQFLKVLMLGIWTPVFTFAHQALLPTEPLSQTSKHFKIRYLIPNKEFLFRICDGHVKLKTKTSNTLHKWVNQLNQYYMARKTYSDACKAMPSIISYWRNAQR